NVLAIHSQNDISLSQSNNIRWTIDSHCSNFNGRFQFKFKILLKGDIVPVASVFVNHCPTTINIFGHGLYKTHSIVLKLDTTHIVTKRISKISILFKGQFMIWVIKNYIKTP